MKNLLLLSFIALFISACQQNQSTDDVRLSQSEHLVGATNWFQKSAEMRACYYQTYELAKYKLNENKMQYMGTKPTAVILDIDETVLDNSPFEVHLIGIGGLYSGTLWKEWTDKVQAKALPGALEFTKYAQSIGVEVIYISNRKVNELAGTLENLKKEGFPNADSAFVLLRPMDKSGDKTERRNKIAESYEVLLFIGDNLTDFSEDYAERDADLGFALVDSTKALLGNKYIILPNPMYGEWEGAIYGNDYSKSAAEKRALRKDVLDGY
jgi:5'-nucleotidase (lipoprotein e(P4) family)